MNKRNLYFIIAADVEKVFFTDLWKQELYKFSFQ